MMTAEQEAKPSITVSKLDAAGNEKLRYRGTVIEYLANGVVIEAGWAMEARDLGYTRFEPGDRFIEYYYTDCWYNIFDTASADGQRKGWYCNVAEPAKIVEGHIEQVDLDLDVWVSTTGEVLVLDEDEFAEDRLLSDEQRERAREGLRELLSLIERREGVFAHLP